MKFENIILYSGGFDSTALLLTLLKVYNIPADKILALNINYGQKNIPEILAAKYFTNKYNIVYQLLDISILANEIFKISALVNKEIQVDTNEKIEQNKQPNTYVPNRNAIFINIAAAIAENIGANNIYTAIQPHEKYFYWDASKLFVDKINEVFQLNPYTIKVVAPFSTMSKQEIFNLAKKYNFDNELRHSWSCYSPIRKETDDKIIYEPCGQCGSCLERENICPQEPKIIDKFVQKISFESGTNNSTR